MNNLIYALDLIEHYLFILIIALAVLLIGYIIGFRNGHLAAKRRYLNNYFDEPTPPQP